MILLLAAASAYAKADPVISAKGVLTRLIGARADDFVLTSIPKRGELDVFEVSAHDGKVYVAGSSGVAICRGAYEYLRDACNCMVSWEGSNINLPALMPDYPRREVVCPNRYRHYLNVCTFGYSTVWWDWNRWQKEIDWMALHGINMPLAMNGQEAIWQRVWKSYGLTERDLDSYFPGPSFLPWFRMGNLTGHMGPLPQHWIDSQFELQKKILAEERALGMTPILPAFSSFVPPAFAEKHPEAKIRKSSGWNGFEPTLLLDPKDPLFTQIGARFIKEMKKDFGTDHLYLADVFNEMDPVVTPETKLADLADTGESISKSILAGDEKGVWVMQGWLFYSSADFWGDAETRSYLSRVPRDRMIVLDLACESYEVWRKQAAVRERHWICCILHNYGQRTPARANLSGYASVPFRALNDPNHGGMTGMGLTMEGIEQNSVLYELLTDAMWRSEPFDWKSWNYQYCLSRYGKCPPAMFEAWGLLNQTVYGPKNNEGIASYSFTPSVEYVWKASTYDPAKLRRAIELMLSCSDELGDNGLYRRDLVDAMKSYVSLSSSKLQANVMKAHKAGDAAELEKAGNIYISALHDIDRLLATRPEYHLTANIDSARACGATAAESDLYEQNARTLITTWGRDIENSDYAVKEWTGVMGSYYIPRWEQFIGMLKKSVADHKPADPNWKKQVSDWDWAWTRDRIRPCEPESGNEVTVVRELLNKFPGQ
jgi:alpha-N-acetylglucosaminidase